MTTKICTKCKIEQPAIPEYFGPDRRNKDGLQSACRTCYKTGRNVINKRYKQQHPERVKKASRTYRLFKFYNLTPKQHLRMYIDQDGCCAICKQAVPYSKTHTDHNHKTGELRELLCNRCNLCLGTVEDEEFLSKALDYLKKFADRVAE